MITNLTHGDLEVVYKDQTFWVGPGDMWQDMQGSYIVNFEGRACLRRHNQKWDPYLFLRVLPIVRGDCAWILPVDQYFQVLSRESAGEDLVAILNARTAPKPQKRSKKVWILNENTSTEV